MSNFFGNQKLLGGICETWGEESPQLNSWGKHCFSETVFSSTSGVSSSPVKLRPTKIPHITIPNPTQAKVAIRSIRCRRSRASSIDFVSKFMSKQSPGSQNERTCCRWSVICWHFTNCCRQSPAVVLVPQGLRCPTRDRR